MNTPEGAPKPEDTSLPESEIVPENGVESAEAEPVDPDVELAPLEEVKAVRAEVEQLIAMDGGLDTELQQVNNGSLAERDIHIHIQTDVRNALRDRLADPTVADLVAVKKAVAILSSDVTAQERTLTPEWHPYLQQTATDALKLARANHRMAFMARTAYCQKLLAAPASSDDRLVAQAQKIYG